MTLPNFAFSKRRDTLSRLSLSFIWGFTELSFTKTSLRKFAIACLFVLPFPALADKVALVIGMAEYEHVSPLVNTVNDARDLAATLEGIGFEVTLSLDASLAELTETMDEFAFRSETADLSMIYFAGHGVEVQGQNFLIPVDANVQSNADVQQQSVSLAQFEAVVDRARKMRIVILDSCRDNPFAGVIDVNSELQPAATGEETTRSAGSVGLAPVDPERGTLVAFAARGGQVALDGMTDNSPYARALMARMSEPGLELSLMFRQVRDLVLAETANLQEPFTYGSLGGTPFYIAGPVEGEEDIGGLSDLQAAWSNILPEAEAQLLALAETGDTRSMLGLAYIRLNPNEGRFDMNEAVSYLERAAAADMRPQAQFELAKILEQGRGVPPDPVRALALYQSSADQNYANAINDLGFLHYQGQLGLTANPDLALEYFERAADLRHPQAQFNFAALIDDGLIADKGPEDAAAYLYQALRSGSADVLNLLAERPTMFSLATRQALQVQLRNFNFYGGTIDSDFGPGTQQGIRAAFGLTE